MGIISNRILRVMRYVMPLFYLVIGLMLAFTNFLGDETGNFRLPLGIVLIAYSIFRTWRIIKDPANIKENEPSPN